MRMEDLIKEKLENGLQISHLEIINESAKHKGHAGDNGSGQTHFKLIVVSDAFEGQTRIQRHYLVYSLLDIAFKQGLHALSMSLMTPEEFAKK